MKTVIIFVTATEMGEDFGVVQFENDWGTEWNAEELEKLMREIRKCDMELDELEYNVTYVKYDGEIPKKLFDDLKDTWADYDQCKAQTAFWGGYVA